ncbi:MAG TPA: type II secretion system protein N [Noviherbaspirillum sp.]
MNKRWPLIASFLLFILLCVSAAYWGLQLFQPPPRPVAAPPRPAAPEISPQAAAALFGGGAGTAVASNYQLHGVIYAGTPRDSVAILSADGKPAQAVRAGTEVVPGVNVKEVHRGFVLLEESGTVKRVDLPDEAPPDTSSVSPVPTRPAFAPPAPPPPPVPEPVPQAPNTAGAAGDAGQSSGVPDAASKARAQRDLMQGRQNGAQSAQPAQSDGGASAGQPDQTGEAVQFAPQTPSSVVVNPGGGIATGTPPVNTGNAGAQ